MTEIPFVKSDQIECAREMEQAVLDLPEDLVFCVGVKVEPTMGDADPTYFVTVGCHPWMDPNTCSTAVFMQLRKRWKFHKIDVTSFRGTTRNPPTPLTS